MLQKFSQVIFFVLFAYLQANSQACTVLGQNPSTAFPVCGTDTFSQSIVPYCGGKLIPGPCKDDGVADVNPFWYKFTCYKDGTLGFFITPDDLFDDYDWQIFDITGHNPNDVYTNATLFVACNWSAVPGLTGTSATGTSLRNCAGFAYPAFSTRPVLKLGHNYIMLISHFTAFDPSEDGYKLSFGGGTASITDPVLPNIMSAASSCDATQIVVKLNKKMKCSSLTPDGSDFSIAPSNAAITAATGINCNSGFDVDSLILTMKSPLPPGNYTITVKNGTDGNTLLDYCDRNIVPGNNIPLVIIPLRPTPMDSLTRVACAPQSLQLVFKKNIQCNTIAADGSDFIVTGTTPVTVTGAAGICSNDVSNIINITLSAPIERKGNYKITLVTGRDGNTIFDECGQETPAGSNLDFATSDTVSAAFTYNISAGCRVDTVYFHHDGRDEVNRWLWALDYFGTSNLRNPTAYFSAFGLKQIKLSVSNGVCSDTITQTVSLDNTLKAAFETNNILCPEDAAMFVSKSIGDINNYFWNFGNGNTSRSSAPPPMHYPILDLEKTYPVSLIVENTAGCFDTVTNNLKVLKSCYIAVPTAFTPNGDGLNDYLYPVNAYKADNLEFNVYNRVGQLVFHSKDWTIKWNGTIKGNPQDPGIYVWTLKYTDHDTGKKIFLKGSTVLIR